MEEEEEEKKEEEEGVLPPHIPAVMGSDVCVTSSPLLAEMNSRNRLD